MSTKKILSLMIASSFLTLGPIGCGRQQESESSSVVVPPPVVPMPEVGNRTVPNQNEAADAEWNSEDNRIKMPDNYKGIVSRNMVSQPIILEADGSFVQFNEWIANGFEEVDVHYPSLNFPDAFKKRIAVFGRPDNGILPLHQYINRPEPFNTRLAYRKHEIYEGEKERVLLDAERSLRGIIYGQLIEYGLGVYGHYYNYAKDCIESFLENFEALYETGNLQGKLALMADQEGLLHFVGEDAPIAASPYKVGMLKTKVGTPFGQVVRRVANRHQLLWVLSGSGRRFDPVNRALFDAAIATVVEADRRFYEFDKKVPLGNLRGLAMLAIAQEMSDEILFQLAIDHGSKFRIIDNLSRTQMLGSFPKWQMDEIRSILDVAEFSFNVKVQLISLMQLIDDWDLSIKEERKNNLRILAKYTNTIKSLRKLNSEF